MAVFISLAAAEELHADLRQAAVEAHEEQLSETRSLRQDQAHEVWKAMQDLADPDAEVELVGDALAAAQEFGYAG